MQEHQADSSNKDRLEAGSTTGSNETLPTSGLSLITVHTATAGGEVETVSLPQEATVLDLKNSYKDVRGMMFKLIDDDGRELANSVRLQSLEGVAQALVLNVTRVNLTRAIDLEALKTMEPTLDPFNQEKFDFSDKGLFPVTIGHQRYDSELYTMVTISDPQPKFDQSEALQGYRDGYFYYETFEDRDRGDGRLRPFAVHEQEFITEFQTRLASLKHMQFRIFENPNRIHKISGFLDKEAFQANRENLFRFLEVFFEILIDKGAACKVPL